MGSSGDTTERVRRQRARAEPRRPGGSARLGRTGGRPWPRAAAFRLAAIVLALAPFAAAELLFVGLGWGRPTQHDDPFVGFSAVQPLFVPSEAGSRHETARSRLRCFQPQSFSAVKDANEFRIFSLGGSTVQGNPYSVETSFTTWLEMDLRLADPSRKWKSINCGGISYASYRLVPILKEVLGHRPDLVILATGHNEFLEDREYSHIRDRPRWLAGPWELVARTRSYNLLQEGLRRLRGTSFEDDAGSRTVLQADVDALLDYRGGLEKYHRDEAWRQGVIEHYRYNVARMVRMARQARVRMILVNLVSNLRDCPPFKSEHRAGLSDEELRHWRELVRQAADFSGTDRPRAAELLRRAMAIDDQHAGLHYQLAKELDGMEDYRGAYQEYLQAKELDICPLRIVEPMNQTILDIARQTGTPVVDARRLIEGLSPNGIPGDYYMSDHVHPKIAAHRLIAEALTQELERQGLVHARPGWRDQREKLAQKHLASLGYQYFAQGLWRLENLRGWAAGRATLEPPTSRPVKR